MAGLELPLQVGFSDTLSHIEARFSFPVCKGAQVSVDSFLQKFILHGPMHSGDGAWPTTLRRAPPYITVLRLAPHNPKDDGQTDGAKKF